MRARVRLKLAIYAQMGTMTELTVFTEALIKEQWRPHGLEEEVRRQLSELQSWTLKTKREWNPTFAENALERTTNQALELAKRGEKNLSYYFGMALKNGWIANWYGAFAMGSI